MPQLKQKTVDGTTVTLKQKGSGRSATYQVKVNGTVKRRADFKEGAMDMFFDEVQKLEGTSGSPANSLRDALFGR